MATMSRVSVLLKSSDMHNILFQIGTKKQLYSITRCHGFCSSAPVGAKPVRIGCASGFWGDTATSGLLVTVAQLTVSDNY